jgi:hypothetical protein
MPSVNSRKIADIENRAPTAHEIVYRKSKADKQARLLHFLHEVMEGKNLRMDMRVKCAERIDAIFARNETMRARALARKDRREARAIQALRTSEADANSVDLIEERARELADEREEKEDMEAIEGAYRTVAAKAADAEDEEATEDDDEDAVDDDEG